MIRYVDRNNNMRKADRNMVRNVNRDMIRYAPRDADRYMCVVKPILNVQNSIYYKGQSIKQYFF